MFIEKDESTAVRRRIPFRVFLSNGTAADTGVSNDTVMGSANGAAQFSLGSASAISANAGMYYIEPTQSNVSTLGVLAVWYDLGDFPQHVANVQIVNFNPFSSFSNIAAGSYSGVTIQGVTRVNSNVTIANATYSAVTVQVTGLVPASFTAGAIDAAALATDAGAEIADAVLDRDMATGTDSGSSTVRTLRNAARALRNRVTSDATQIQVYEEDDATVAWTASISTVASTNAHISGYDPTS